MAVYRKKTGKRKAFKSNRKTVKKPTIKKMIKTAIHRTIENKSRQEIVTTAKTLYSANSAALLDGSIIPLTPFATSLQVDQGVGAANRVGNKINLRKLTFKGTIFPQPYDGVFNVSPQPLQVKLWIFYDKRDPTIKPTPAAQGNFFQNDNSTTTFSNNLSDLWKPINTDIYRVVATKMFKLGNAINTSSGTNAAASDWTNNDFKYNCNFSIPLTKHCVKNIKFNDNNSNPTTRGLFAMFQCVYASGGAVSSGQILAKMYYMLDMEFEDA